MSFSRVLIAGCGYLGTRLGQKLTSGGSEVYGLRRSARTALPDGIISILADLTRRATLTPLPEVDLAIVCQAPGKTDSYSRTYLDGTKNVLDALRRQGEGHLPQVVFVSSTSIYSTKDGAWVDEQADPRQPGHPENEAGENAETLLSAEEAVLQSGFPVKVIRSSGIYGPDRNRLNPILEGLFSPELSEDFTNRIRVEDLVSAILTAAEKGKNGEIYLASDNQPATQREFYEWLYQELKKTVPTNGEDSVRRHGGNKRCRNDKLRSLGWTPQFPTYKEGYAALLASIAQRRA